MLPQGLESLHKFPVLYISFWCDYHPKPSFEHTFNLKNLISTLHSLSSSTVTGSGLDRAGTLMYDGMKFHNLLQVSRKENERRPIINQTISCLILKRIWCSCLIIMKLIPFLTLFIHFNSDRVKWDLWPYSYSCIPQSE